MNLESNKNKVDREQFYAVVPALNFLPVLSFVRLIRCAKAQISFNAPRLAQSVISSFAAVLVTLLLTAQGAHSQVCAIPGDDGPANISGVINTYYPSPVTATTTGNSIPVSAVTNPQSAFNAIEPGDLLLVMQVQNAQINSSNNNNYGAGDGTGRGFTSGSAGRYEYAVATNSVGLAGGTITTLQNLTRTYRSSPATSTRGR
ncbi:MAG: hypothetical protein HKN25_13955, partial [Pyrinomonadaceae bacterium]|nr:hypothetical protein [Pyrinomonadaceae bacterium]